MDDKYSQWLKDYRDEIEKGAAKIKLDPMSPYWEGEWSKDSAAISGAVATAMRNYDGGKYNDFSFVNQFMNQKDFENPSSRVTALKQYFRFNQKTTDTVNNVSLSGDELAKRIGGFLDYCINLKKNSDTHVSKLEIMLKSSLKKTSVGKDAENPKEQGQNESLDVGTWLSVEQRYVAESSLNVLSNYVSLLEGESGSNPNGDIKNPPTNPNKKVDEPENGTTVRTASDDSAEGGSSETKDNKSEGDSYLKDIENFMRDAIRAYLTAFNE
jgi:hypothetical protein